jgi:uncharacterized membrane protein YfcA
MDAHLLIGLTLSAAIGLSLGLIGGGGSIITVPVLVYVIGVDAREAVGMSLAVVGVTSLIGASLHHRRGTVNPRAGALFGAAGILGAYFGSRLTYLVPPSVLLLSFAALMLTIAALMLAQRRGGAKQEAAAAGETVGHRASTIKAIAAGLVVGALTGFLGVGGGFLVVPALVLFGGLTMKEAVGTSLLVIAINCAAGLLGHLQYGGFDLRLTFLVTALAAFGTLAGTALSHRMSPARLRTGFAMFTIAVAFFLVAKNYSVLFH